MTAGNVDDQENSTELGHSSSEPPPKQRPAHRRRILIGCSVLAGLVVISCICVQIALRVIGGSTDSSPAWSPDGARIAFTSYSPILGTPFLGAPDIYVINADGTELERLTD